ncbi:hypothetical protein FKP32DRAFT_1680344 [Trametes sanguinea]|nr:hypothetical protein FKP32DRAFT_1680344 [Trametes sanguinea]
MNTSAQLPIPLLVEPLLSSAHPAPPGTGTALYRMIECPATPLEYGMRVQLCLAYRPNNLRRPITTQNAPQNDTTLDKKSVSILLRTTFYGHIAGIRAEYTDSFELLIKNETHEAPVRRAFIRCSRSLHGLTIPTLAHALTRHLCTISSLTDCPDRNRWPDEPRERRKSSPALLPPPSRAPDRRESGAATQPPSELSRGQQALAPAAEPFRRMLAPPPRPLPPGDHTVGSSSTAPRSSDDEHLTEHEPAVPPRKRSAT